MASIAGTRPNHYEVLGLKPTASFEEIAHAFARAMGPLRPHSLGGFFEASMAYETLRDPARRKVYDASIGLGQQRSLKERLEGARAIAFGPTVVSASPAPRTTVDPLHRPARQEAPPQPQSRVEEPAPTPFIAAPATRVDRGASAPAARPEIPDLPAYLLASDRPALGVEAAAVEWKRPAMALGGVVVAVGVLAAVAGWSSGLVEQPQPPQRAITAQLPTPKPAPAAIAPASAAPAVAVLEPQYRVPRHFAAASRHVAPARVPVQQPALSDQQLAEMPAVEVHPAATQAADAATAQPAVAEAQAPAATPAKLPLPNSVIARTIGRIGYACGQVASTVAGDGPGVFTVTCTSGHSYRASPVGGRYHFKKLGAH